MYCNSSKVQALPLLFKFSSVPRCLKPSQNIKFSSFSTGVYSKPSLSNGFCLETSESYCLVNPRNWFGQKGLESCNGADSVGQRVSLVGRRSYSSGHSGKVEGGSGGVRGRKALPWIAAYKNKGAGVRPGAGAGVWRRAGAGEKSLEKKPVEKANRSSWEESAKTFLLKNGVMTPVEERRKPTVDKEVDSSEKVAGGKGSGSSGEGLGDEFLFKNRIKPPAENRERRSRMVERMESNERDESGAEEQVEEEVIDDPRWDNIKTRYKTITERRDDRFEKPEFRQWNKQENWGRKTWKEATVSTLPKMSGEGVYGVGPVLAALSAGRREFYTLYVQEGLDLSSNNRKKKDKKGFEKVLKIAEKIGLKAKEAPKHDLNMIVDNRPHQGLVLDASPLEMVSIRELDPVYVDGKIGPLWVALDEVTDPQNLGAIIRSAYFFGAAGVVLCAKNSAPLTGVVSKASAGSLELMELRSCKNMMQFLSSSADNGWRVIGGSISSRALPLHEVPAGAPTILVLGSEGTGLRPLVERSCTELVKIPGNIPVDIPAQRAEDENSEEVDRCLTEEFQSFLAVESLNVSVAAGVLLHHLIGKNTDGQLGNKQPSMDS